MLKILYIFLCFVFNIIVNNVIELQGLTFYESLLVKINMFN